MTPKPTHPAGRTDRPLERTARRRGGHRARRRRCRAASASPARAGSSPSRCCSSGSSSCQTSEWAQPRQRPGRLRDPAADRPAAHRLAHRRACGRSTASHRAGRDRRRHRAARRADRVPALAPPVHSSSALDRRSSSSASILYAAVRAAPAVRRHDHRPLGRLLAPAPPVAVAALLRGRRSSTRSCRPARAGRSPRSSAGVVVAVVRRSQLYLGSYHPSDIVVGVAHRRSPSSVNAFRFFTPNEVFPVAYRRGKTAHLDVGGRRGEAIRQAVEDQLGLTVLDIKPVGLAGSGGSTPLRLTRRGRPRHVPVREALRDEPRARRPLVQARPDDPLRAARGRGAVPVGAPARGVRGLHAAAHARRRHPDRRAVRHRRDHARARVPARHRVLRRRGGDRRRRGRRRRHRRRACSIVRQLWDAGLAHRDIKPANLLVRDGQSSSSTSPSCRCGRRRGARPSTSPT